MKRRLPAIAVMFWAAFVAGHAHPALSEERRVALIIGNANYASSPPLRNPVNDATDIAAALGKLRFELLGGKAHLNLKRAEMVRLVREFGASLNSGDIGLFYFAGHGLQFSDENYLLPVDDAEIKHREDVPDWAVNLNSIRRQIEGTSGVTSILVLDACRNNPLPSRMSGRSAARGLTRVEALAGSYVAFATGPGEEADDGAGRNGRFTAALLAALSQPDRRIDDLFMEVRASVRKQSGGRQVPWTSSSLEKPFYFLVPNVEREGVRQTLVPANAPTSSTHDPNPSGADVAFWNSISNSGDVEDFKLYRKRFPEGLFIDLANKKIKALSGSQVVAALQAPPPPRKTINMTGVWRGTYTYANGKAVPFTLTLASSGKSCQGRIEEPNTFGDKSAQNLYASITCNAGEIEPEQNFSFVKTYDGTGGQNHSVHYNGVLSRGGDELTGTWRIKDTRGSFRLAR